MRDRRFISTRTASTWLFDIPPNLDSARRDIFLLAVDGGREIPAVVHPADDRLAGWTPDGKNLLFLSDRSGTTGMWMLPFANGKFAEKLILLKHDVPLGRPIGLTYSGA